MLKYRLVASMFILIYFIGHLYPRTQPIMLLALIIYFFINPQNKFVQDVNIHNQKQSFDNRIIRQIKNNLCILFLIATAPLIYLALFMLIEGVGYVSKAAIILTCISFISWIFIENIVSKNNIQIFPEKFPENLKNIISIVFFCLMYIEIFISDPSGHFLFFSGIMYIIINFLTYFISIVTWK